MSGNPAEEMALIRMQVTELREKTDDLSLKKKSLEAEMSQLNSRVRSSNTHKTRLSTEEYRQICGRQSAIRRRILEIDSEFGPIKKQIRRLNDDENVIRASSGLKINDYATGPAASDGDLSKRIIEIRSHWQNFAGDQTRINSMRIMAAQFAEELTAALSGK